MNIRDAGPLDLAALTVLVNAAYRGESSRLGWTTEAELLDGQRVDQPALEAVIADPRSTIRVIEKRSMMVACVHLTRTDRGIYLGMLSVSPPLQRAGLGRALIADAVRIAQAGPVPRVWMTVIHSRQELIDWYGRQGFVKTGEREPFPVHDPRFGIPKVAPQLLEFVVLERSC
jgi:ribosomal protein S18 acetylase RimI-like enzyme